jgi:Bardet-Biedl syndrome 7 protein
MQSSVPVDLLPVESNEAILSRSPEDRENGNVLLATYRCQENVNRLEMRIRTVEGQYGTVQLLVIAKVRNAFMYSIRDRVGLCIFICSQMNPKTAQSVKLDIKPLSLHHRLHAAEEEEEMKSGRAMNSLRFSGSFTLLQMHEWVCMCLPNCPQRIQEEEVSMCFRNAYVASILTCKYRKGDANFSSDSVSTIAILKEVRRCPKGIVDLNLH